MWWRFGQSYQRPSRKTVQATDGKFKGWLSILDKGP